MEIIKGKNTISYRESIVIDGKVIKSPSFKRRTDCKDWLSEKRSGRSKSKLYGDFSKLHDKILFKDYASDWLLTKKVQGSARSTLANYERYVRVHFIPIFGSMDLKQIGKKEIEFFQAKLQECHNPKGVNLIIIALKSIFKEAIKDGYLLRNPGEFIRTLSSDTANEVYWTLDEIKQFLTKNVSHELVDFFILALNTGMRKGELAGLCWDRISFIENTITVTRTRDRYELKERTKTKLKRVIPMNGFVKLTLLRIFNSRKTETKYVFVKEDGSPIETHHIYRTFASAQKNADMKQAIRFHDIRHTFASQFMLNGGNIYDLQKILGHTSILMTQKYAHLSIDHLHDAMKSFSLGSEEIVKYKPGSLNIVPKHTDVIKDQLGGLSVKETKPAFEEGSTRSRIDVS